jgi:hypothetical protein
MLTLYLRREPTTDAELLHWFPNAKRRDVVAYSDPEASQLKARWPWHYRSKPDRRFKRVMLNCYRWRVVWLPDLA